MTLRANGQVAFSDVTIEVAANAIPITAYSPAMSWVQTHSAPPFSDFNDFHSKSFYQKNNAGNCNNGNCAAACNCGNIQCNNCLITGSVNCVNCDAQPTLQNDCNCTTGAYNCVAAATTYNCNCPVDCDCACDCACAACADCGACAVDCVVDCNCNCPVDCACDCNCDCNCNCG